MRIHNKYIVSLVITSCVINALLVFFGQDNIEIYYTVNITTYLAVTLLYICPNPRAKIALNPVGTVLFAGFILTGVFKAMNILSVR